jgi:hypothetical protein
MWSISERMVKPFINTLGDFRTMCFGGPKISTPEPPPLPQKEDANVARDRELMRRGKQKGFRSTLMSAPLGAAPSGSIAVKTLLGG